MISKIANVALGLVFVGSSVFAQSQADAKKAIDAEQYQKAKSMLKNLTVTQPTNDENFFYLGWVYLIQEYPDSAKNMFTRGLAANPKSPLNYVGLGAVAHYNKDAAGVTTNFNAAIPLTGKKDSRPWLFMGEAYLLLPPGVKAVSADDATAAKAALNKGKAANPKDVDVLIQLGNAERSQPGGGSEAFSNYQDASLLDPRSAAAITAMGILDEYAQNYEDAEPQFQKAIAIDPNYGPAYRGWAETDLDYSKSLSHTDQAKAATKIHEAVDHYKKYLSLTDNSTETLLRYADFLYFAGQYEELQQVANTLAKAVNSNARVYRYIGYADYQTKDYPGGVAAMNNWFTKAEPGRILPNDYFVLGRLYIEGKIDTAKGIEALEKGVDLDTTKAEETYHEIAQDFYYRKHKYAQAAATYEKEFTKVHGRTSANDHLYLGLSYFYEFGEQAKAATANPSIKADSSLLTKADTAISVTQRIAGSPSVFYPWYKALIYAEKDADYDHLKGLAKPYYDQVIAIIAPKAPPLTAQDKRFLVASYVYEGYYYTFKEKDDVKATEYFNKVKELDPENKAAAGYFDTQAKIAEQKAKMDEYNRKKAAADAAKKKPGQ